MKFLTEVFLKFHLGILSRIPYVIPPRYHWNSSRDAFRNINWNFPLRISQDCSFCDSYHPRFNVVRNPFRIIPNFSLNTFWIPIEVSHAISFVTSFGVQLGLIPELLHKIRSKIFLKFCSEFLLLLFPDPAFFFSTYQPDFFYRACPSLPVWVAYDFLPGFFQSSFHGFAR